MNDRDTRRQALLRALDERILLLDGATGTMIQAQDLHADDFGGAAYEGCNEILVRTRPDVMLRIHRDFLAAGADIIETDTFGGTRVVLAEYRLEHEVELLNRTAAKLARQAADEASTPDRPRFVAGSMGPTTKAISVTGGISFDQLRQDFYQQAKALLEGGADILLIETAQDTRNIKAALLGVARAKKETGFDAPVMVSGTIEPMGTMLGGQTADALWSSISHAELLSVGLNCATGPEFMTDHIRTLSELANVCISCYPNAGLPREDGTYAETPETLTAQLGRFVEHGWLNIVGGCCGTTPAHIAALAAMIRGKEPRRIPPPTRRAFYSGIELVEAEESNRPLLVGERTNVIGSRAFKDLVNEEKWEEATEIGRRQVRNGAQVIDVCLQSSERDEAKDIPPFYENLIRKIKAPIMIDTTDPESVERSLTYCQGKSIINSINLEDGEEKFELICPLIRAYGAAVVVGCIDEDKLQAQAFTRERKLEIARRSCDLLESKYKVTRENVIIDPLVFPCATGDENYVGGAVETIEAIRLIKAEIPDIKTILGISNISFGLPALAREVVNSVFLYHCTKAGLDLAIVNSERIERFASISEQERRLAENLLFNTPPAEFAANHPNTELFRLAPEDWRQQSRDQKVAINQFHIAAVTDHFRKTVRQKKKAADLPLDQRLSNYILEGSQDGLVADLDKKLAEGSAPLAVINGPLMAGMTEVGRLFNNNELIVAEVLQSAEAMKKAVSHLEKFMEKSETGKRGKIVLATVKGDVHDIGKNLVEIILSNNGYDVVNLGIKVPPEELIQACHTHSPDAVGLSGLLVKSAQQMVITAGDLREAGIELPLLVGGAALSDKFTRSKIAPSYAGLTLYAKDAMTGLRLMNEIMDPAQRDKLEQVVQAPAPVAIEPQVAAKVAVSEQRSSRVRANIAIPPAPYLDRKVRDLPNLAEIWTYINPYMLYGRNLGFKGNFGNALQQRDSRAIELFHKVGDVKQEVAQWMKARAVWQFYETERDGNSIHFFAPGASSPLHTFRFGRQAKPDGLCLSDYVLETEEGRRDHVVLFVVSAGEGVRDHVEKDKSAGAYFKAHATQALATETAEAVSEWLHRRLREEWGFPDPPAMTMQERFTSKYRGKRYSFGYGACPNMDDQLGLWKLLRPADIGVQLTEGMMMEPEASVSALVFHHPDCAYFTAYEETDSSAASEAAPKDSD